MSTTTPPRWPSFLTSPIGKKLITGLTGLGLTVFVFTHMTGNLTLFLAGEEAYNIYANFLEGLGPGLYLIEAGLFFFFVFHIVYGVNIWLAKRKARAQGYEVYRSAGRPSMQSLSSRSMILTGGILAVFLVIHLLSFKFGPGGPLNEDPAYVTSVGGVEMRDLAKLVMEKFQSPLYAFGYPAVMILLGFHLRHGIWSALQSLGAMRPHLTPVVYTLGGLIAVIIAAGFIVLPAWIFFTQ